ncbi:MAG: hypothetical protein ACO1OF_17005 [Adhaeribacter sp.]
MKKIITLLLILFPVTLFAQELIGKKKKYISSIKPTSTLIVDLPNMSIWSNKAEAGSLYLICYFNNDKCDKTVSIYPNEKLQQWEKILNSNCAKVKGEELLWLDQRRQLYFRVIPCENQTFALESTKAND